MNSEQIRQRLADLEAKVQPAEAVVRAAAFAAEASGDEAAYRAAVGNLNNLQRDIERSRHALAEAERREAEEAEAKRTKEQKERADAEERARLSLHKGKLTVLTNWHREASRLPEACSALANIFAAMVKHQQSFDAGLPRDVPDNAVWRAFTARTFSGIIAAELRRAGHAAGVELPGAAREPPTVAFAPVIDGIRQHLGTFAEDVIIRGKRYVAEPEAPPTFVEPPRPPGELVKVRAAALPGTVRTQVTTGGKPRDETDEEFAARTAAAYEIRYPDGTSIPAPPPQPGERHGDYLTRLAPLLARSTGAIPAAISFNPADIAHNAPIPGPKPAPSPTPAPSLPPIDLAEIKSVLAEHGVVLAPAAPIDAGAEMAAASRRLDAEMAVFAPIPAPAEPIEPVEPEPATAETAPTVEE